MNILAVDTAGKTAGVALLQDDRLPYEVYLDAGMTHSVTLMPMIDTCLKMGGITCADHDLTGRMVIGTSAIVDADIDGAVGMNSGIFNNPFLIWGRYRRKLLKTVLPISFQFHHTQMDGAHAGRFLALVQQNIRTLVLPKAGKERIS